jgi:hypothetical protein
VKDKKYGNLVPVLGDRAILFLNRIGNSGIREGTFRDQSKIIDDNEKNQEYDSVSTYGVLHEER